MDLSSTFNTAASDFGGDSAAPAGGPGSPGPGGSPAAAAASAETALSSPAQQSANLAEGFNAAAENTGLGQAEDSGHVSDQPELSVDAAEAELEMLEQGRAKPAARHNLNPPPNLLKIAQTRTERQREARIGALKAYLEFRQDDAAHAAEHEQRDELEFNL